MAGQIRDCSHTVEPGCAVAAALADGTLELARWQSYGRLQRATAADARLYFSLDRAAVAQPWDTFVATVAARPAAALLPE